MKYNLNTLAIHKRCAELLGLNFAVADLGGGVCVVDLESEDYFEPSVKWQDCGPIIEKIWDNLMFVSRGPYDVKWDSIMEEYECTQLEAACICFIEYAEK